MSSLLRKVDLISLRLFVAVCKERNIARAAAREFIAPSAVSRRIGEMEAAIGFPLIYRESRGISVTPVGETVLRHAQDIIATIEALGAELSQFASGVKGTVRLVGNLSAIVQFLPEDIAAFQRVYPDIDIVLEEQTSVDVMRSVAAHEADLGICIALPGAEQFDVLAYRTDRLTLMVPRSHRLSGANAVGLADILSESFVALDSESALTQLLVQQATTLDATLSIKIRVSSLDALCRMVHVGLGIAVVPQQIAEMYLNNLDVRLVPLHDAWSVRQLIVITRKHETLSATTHSLVDFLSNS
jgi:DNA-binding transcriptional LysR family regulator